MSSYRFAAPYVARLCLASIALALTACHPASSPSTPPEVAVTDALCRPTLNGRDVTACYVTMTASQNDRLVSVGSSVSGTAQIHEMKTDNGIMTMAELPAGLPLPAGKAVTLKPSGNHIMLMQLQQRLTAGDLVSLTLTFEHAPQIAIRAAVSQPPIPRGY